ncbi:hypothetical protein [Pontibacter chitinilyticus]
MSKYTLGGRYNLGFYVQQQIEFESECPGSIKKNYKYWHIRQ